MKFTNEQFSADGFGNSLKGVEGLHTTHVGENDSLHRNSLKGVEGGNIIDAGVRALTRARRNSLKGVEGHSSYSIFTLPSSVILKLPKGSRRSHNLSSLLINHNPSETP